jgi:hypothetical protein
LESGYISAICSAISELVTPQLPQSAQQAVEHADGVQTPSIQTKREKAFHDILGLVMACLSSEAYIEATGSWIAMAYRIWLDHCPAEMNPTTQQWRGLFSGLQVGKEKVSRHRN